MKGVKVIHVYWKYSLDEPSCKQSSISSHLILSSVPLQHFHNPAWILSLITPKSVFCANQYGEAQPMTWKITAKMVSANPTLGSLEDSISWF